MNMFEENYYDGKRTEDGLVDPAGFALVGMKKIHLDLIVSLLYRVRLGESPTERAAYELLMALGEFDLLPVGCSRDWPEDYCTIEV